MVNRPKVKSEKLRVKSKQPNGQWSMVKKLKVKSEE